MTLICAITRISHITSLIYSCESVKYCVQFNFLKIAEENALRDELKKIEDLKKQVWM